MRPTSATGPSDPSRWAAGMSAVSMILGTLAILVALLPGPFYRMRVYGLADAFGMVKWGGYGGILAVLLAILALILMALTGRPKYFMGALIGMVFGGLAWGIPYLWIQPSGPVPAMYDISTDIVNPPRFQPQVLALRKQANNSAVYAGAGVASLQSKAYPDIQPMVFKLPTTAVYAAALRTVGALHWKLDSNDPVAGIIEATATSFWFGFKDDVVIRVRAAGDTTRLDMRSESRNGKNDMGKNAQHIRAFRAALYARLSLRLPERHQL